MWKLQKIHLHIFQKVQERRHINIEQSCEIFIFQNKLRKSEANHIELCLESYVTKNFNKLKPTASFKPVSFKVVLSVI